MKVMCMSKSVEKKTTCEVIFPFHVPLPGKIALRSIENDVILLGTNDSAARWDLLCTVRPTCKLR